MSGGKRMLTAVTLDARWAGAAPARIGQAAEAVNAAGVDLLILGGAALGLDSLIVAGWLARRLKRAGLVAVLPALHTLPFHAARALSALDFLTHGRSGWAPTTLGHAEQTKALGPRAVLDGEQALAKAVDFIDATCSLWDSWDADALIIDKAGGVYLDSSRVRRVHYRGPYFQVMGPLNAARPPQGYPVLVQTDADPLWALTAGRVDVVMVQALQADGLVDRRATVAEAGGQARLLATIDLEADGPVSAIAERLQGWLEADLIDGVHLALSGPEAVQALTGDLFPQLRRRGLLTPEVGSGSLRARLGLPDHANAGPAHRFVSGVEA